MEDGLIVELYWKRNEQAISETQLKYGNYLTKIAYNVLCDLEDTKESVNDTYLKAWNSMPEHRPKQLASYLGRITRRLSIDIYRKKHSEKRGGGEYAASLSELAECVGGEDSPERETELRQLANEIENYIKTLPRKSREIFVCRYFFMDSIRDISKSSGASESKVKSILYRTRLGLKEYLEKEEFML